MRRWLAGSVVLALAACSDGAGWPDYPEPSAGSSVFSPGAEVDLAAADAIEGMVWIDADGAVTGFGGFADVAADLRLRLDEAGDLATLRLTAGGRRTTFALDDPDLERLAEPGSGVAAYGLGDGRAVETVVLITRDALDFDHQMAGIWLGGVKGAGEVHLGSGVFAASPYASDPPAGGTADYQGVLVGIAALDEEIGDAQISDGVGGVVRLEVDFAAQRIDLVTEESLLDDERLEALDMTGTLTIDGARFAGPVTTSGGLTGNVVGRFHGPGGIEAGAVFELVGEGVERFIGAFGAAR